MKGARLEVYFTLQGACLIGRANYGASNKKREVALWQPPFKITVVSDAESI